MSNLRIEDAGAIVELDEVDGGYIVSYSTSFAILDLGQVFKDEVEARREITNFAQQAGIPAVRFTRKGRALEAA